MSEVAQLQELLGVFELAKRGSLRGNLGNLVIGPLRLDTRDTKNAEF